MIYLIFKAYSFGDWKVIVAFNNYGEGMLEMIIFIIGFITTLVTNGWLIVKLVKEDDHEWY